MDILIQLGNYLEFGSDGLTRRGVGGCIEGYFDPTSKLPRVWFCWINLVFVDE